MNGSRGAGVLLPVGSLPGPYGFGGLGAAAHRFLQFLQAAGQSYWQVLPLGPTGFGDSPYQAFSAFAGTPYAVDPDELYDQGLLTNDELQEARVPEGEDIDYAALYRGRFPLLRRAFSRFDRDTPVFRDFCEKEAGWLPDYALFMALKDRFSGLEWRRWDRDIALREPAAVERWRRELEGECAFWAFCQFQFFTQWDTLKTAAHERGIRFIGDIPIYVAPDSADVWAHRELFQLDAEGNPRDVAGVPPDDFSATGQLWGNPLYDWGRMEQDGFLWWRQRVQLCARLYDVIRIDHFIGIARYYAIPAGSDTAMAGEWRPGPGKKLTDAIDQARGQARILAEDLGVLHDSVKALLQETGYPGMRVLLFGMSGDQNNPHLPHNFPRNCVCYVGTHDNETARGFCAEHPTRDLSFMMRYLGVRRKSQLPRALVRAAYASVADTAVVQLQDLLGLGNRARMNTPSTLGGNWQWRVKEEALSGELARKLREMTALYGR